jgi:hypothetical protein
VTRRIKFLFARHFVALTEKFARRFCEYATGRINGRTRIIREHFGRSPIAIHAPAIRVFDVFAIIWRTIVGGNRVENIVSLSFIASHKLGCERRCTRKYIILNLIENLLQESITASKIENVNFSIFSILDAVILIKCCR